MRHVWVAKSTQQQQLRRLRRGSGNRTRTDVEPRRIGERAAGSADHDVESAHGPSTEQGTVVAAPTQAQDWREHFDWRTIDGTVIHVGLSGMIKAPRRWLRTIIKLVLVLGAIVLFGMVALAILLLVLVLGFITSLLSSKDDRSGSGGGGFVQGVATQVVGFFLTRTLLGQRPMVPACDYRVRDTAGQEHLVRVEGYLHAGGMVVGDDISAQGFDRRGTLIMRRGWNKRLNTLIVVKDR